jgi:uncharacterized protein
MTNKYTLFAFIFLVFSVIGCKSVQQGNINSISENQNALLWKIEGNGIKNSSYLFGTIHLIRSADFFLPEGFDQAFNQSQNIVFEIDMSKLDDMAEIMSLLPKVIMKDELSLRDLITDEEYEKVNDYFNNAGIPLFFLEKVKPMFLTIFADPEMKPGMVETGEYKSYEMEFHSLAEEKGKRVLGLESIDYQIGVLDSIPYSEQAQMLIKSIENPESQGSTMDSLIMMYRNQDIEGLHRSIKSDDISKYENILLNDRNENWIPVMSQIMKESPSFFAVGAGHLGGSHGVVSLLRKAGFKVTPVLK